MENGKRVVTGSHAQGNLITNLGMDRFFSTQLAFDRCVVGSGSTPPAFSDTALANLVATTTTIQSEGTWTYLTDPNPIIRKSIRFRFGQGVAAGNLSEIGCAWSAGLFCRALILDSLGDPTTITVLSDEWLDAEYTHELHFSNDDITGTIELDGDDYNYILRPGGMMTQWSVGGSDPARNLRFFSQIAVSGGTNKGGNGAVGTDAVAWNATVPNVSNIDTVENSSYVPGSFERDYTVKFGLNDGNVSGGIRTVIFTPMTTGLGAGGTLKLGKMQAQFDPKIPKTGDDILELTFGVKLVRL